MIVELTDVNGEKIFINSDHIVRFSGSVGYTSIRTADGQWINVKEDADYISSKINNWGK